MNNNSEQAPFRRILVVEDYLDSQEITCELLRLMGHTAEGVSNAEDALAYLDKNIVDVLLTDINLPKMSGVALAEQTILKHPATRIIFASGHVGFDLKTINFSATLLPKPFDLDALTKALEAA
ncbi:MAG TPA: response regulator [Herminiimonas sp.]|jgi:DNA-binding NtrC family response regulator|nr:response regulator [Herminiimonas sp.]